MGQWMCATRWCVCPEVNFVDSTDGYEKEQRSPTAFEDVDDNDQELSLGILDLKKFL